MTFYRNILTTYAAQVVGVMSSFLCSVMAARMLGKVGQAELSLYVGFVAFISLCMSAGLPSGLVHFIAAKKIDKSRIIPFVLVFFPVGLVLVFLIFLLSKSSGMMHIFLPSSVLNSNKWLLIMGLHFFFNIFFGILASILQAESRFAHLARINIISSLLLLCLYGVRYYKFIFIETSNLNWIIISLASVALIQSALFAYALMKFDTSYFRWKLPSLQLMMPLFVFSSLAFLTNFIQFLSYKMDIWFIHYFEKDLNSLGVYTISVLLVQMIWLLPNAVQSVLYTQMSQENDRLLNWNNTLKMTKQLLLYAGVAGLLAFGCFPWLVNFFFGSTYADTIPIIRILLIGILPFCLTMSVSAYFSGTQRVKVCLYAVILGFLVCLIFDLLLIPKWGIEGAAYASVFSYIASTLYLLIAFLLDRYR